MNCVLEISLMANQEMTGTFRHFSTFLPFCASLESITNWSHVDINTFFKAIYRSYFVAGSTCLKEVQDSEYDSQFKWTDCRDQNQNKNYNEKHLKVSNNNIIPCRGNQIPFFCASSGARARKASFPARLSSR